MRSLWLDDTPHCGHFRLHRAQYCAAVAAFLEHDVLVSLGIRMHGSQQMLLRACCCRPQLVMRCHYDMYSQNVRRAQSAQLPRHILHVTRLCLMHCTLH